MTDTPLVEMRNVSKAFGGVHAVEDVTVHVSAGEVLGIVGHNGAGKSTLIKILSGAHTMDSGQVLMSGQPVSIDNPRTARSLGIEALYQNLALADNLDAAANLFLGRELTTPYGKLDNKTMAEATREVIARINPEFANLGTPSSIFRAGSARPSRLHGRSTSTPGSSSWTSPRPRSACANRRRSRSWYCGSSRKASACS